MRHLRHAGRYMLLVCVLGALGAGRAAGGDAPHPDLPFETVRVRIDGETFTLAHRAYPEPLRLDLARATGARDTPFHTLLSYYAALARIVDYAELAPFLRRSDGAPGAPPADPAAHNAAARRILAGGVEIHGEIAFGDYLIYVYRYPASIKRNLGLPVRRFDGGDYYVVQDLVPTSPLAHRLSALRWDVVRLRAEHPPED